MANLTTSQYERLEHILENAPDRLKRTVEAIQYGERIRGKTPLQQPTLFVYPDITSKPWHDPQDFPWALELERNTQTIRDEYTQVAVNDSDKFDEIKSSVDGGQWTTFYFYNQGIKIEENCAKCPQTARLLEEVIGKALARNTGISYAYFSVVKPGTHITAHCGVCNLRLRFQLPIMTPPDCCTMRVGTETRTYREGECFIFDDSYNHEVKHDGDEQTSYDRVVLLLDFWHPELTDLEIEATEMLLPPPEHLD